jgi:hypothetical protein
MDSFDEIHIKKLKEARSANTNIAEYRAEVVNSVKTAYLTYGKTECTIECNKWPSWVKQQIFSELRTLYPITYYRADSALLTRKEVDKIAFIRLALGEDGVDFNVAVK